MLKKYYFALAVSAHLFVNSAHSHIPQAQTHEEEALFVEAMTAACRKTAPALTTDLAEGFKRFESINHALVQRTRAAPEYREHLRVLTEAFVDAFTNQPKICPQLVDDLKNGLKI